MLSPPMLRLEHERCSGVWGSTGVSRGGLWPGRGMGGSREGKSQMCYAQDSCGLATGAPGGPAFLLLSPLMVTASLLASPLNCPFVVLCLGVDARSALLM